MLENPSISAKLSTVSAPSSRTNSETIPSPVTSSSSSTNAAIGVDELTKLLNGSKSEKRPRTEDPREQLFLFTEELRDELQKATLDRGQAETTLEYEGRPRRKGRRKEFPDHLPVIRAVLTLSEKERTCCGQLMEEMGEETRKQMERVELTVIHEIVRKKYCCRKCQGRIEIAPAPQQVIEKEILGASYLAHILMERFGNHMPYYRQEQKYGSERIDLSRSVLCRSAIRCGELLEPIWKQVGAEVISSPVVFTDDTGVRALNADDKERKTARFWVYADKKGRCFYDFTESRRRDGPVSVLQDFKGFLQADAYAGYDCLYAPDGAVEVACWAHARRKFVEAEETEPEIAKEAIDRIAYLYEVEKVCREKNVASDELQAMRQKHSKPILKELGAWLELKKTEVLPKSPIAKAIRYSLNQREALNEYVSDGRLEIDNNRAERALRSIAIGRNYAEFSIMRSRTSVFVGFIISVGFKALCPVPSSPASVRRCA